MTEHEKQYAKDGKCKGCGSHKVRVASLVTGTRNRYICEECYKAFPVLAPEPTAKD